jgi:hypothetical protein
VSDADDEDVQEAVDDVEETEPATPDEADGPDLDDDDMVEIPDDVVEKAAEADAEDGEDAVDEADEESDDQVPTADAGAGDVEDVSLGHVYCKALGMGATIATEKHGEGVDDFEQSMEQFSMMARQCDLDTYVDQWAAEHGGAEMTPSQGILVGTAMFAMGVAASDSTLATNAMEAAR